MFRVGIDSQIRNAENFRDLFGETRFAFPSQNWIYLSIELLTIDVERESNFIGDSTNVEVATGKNDEV